jgi:hypothetical protein
MSILVRTFSTPGKVAREQPFDSFMDAMKQFGTEKFMCKQSPTAIVELLVDGGKSVFIL